MWARVRVRPQIRLLHLDLFLTSFPKASHNIVSTSCLKIYKLRVQKTNLYWQELERLKVSTGVNGHWFGEDAVLHVIGAALRMNWLNDVNVWRWNKWSLFQRPERSKGWDHARLISGYCGYDYLPWSIMIIIATMIMIIESFRFEDENDASTRFNLKFLPVFSKNIQPGKLHWTIFEKLLMQLFLLQKV